MAIPWDWLLRQTTPAEVEAGLAELGVPGLWLRRWRGLLDRMAPGDELWEYCGTEFAFTMDRSTDEITGFDQVLDAEALEQIGLLESVDRITGFRDGFAVVRGDEILDWIEAPPSIA